MTDTPRSSLVADYDALLGRGIQPLLREFQVSELRACFTGDLARVRPIHAWVHGPPGTGKTLCVQHVLAEAQPLGVLPLYVNCRERFTFFSVIEHILDMVKPLRSLQRTKERQLTILRRELADRRAVIALDEVDALSQDDAADLLHHLSVLPRVSVICVGSSRQMLLGLPEPVRSRLAPRQVLFPRYRPDEMHTILDAVVGRALVPGSWTEEALQKVVDQSYGDARRAIALLRHAVQRAVEAKAPRVEAVHLRPSNFAHLETDVQERLDQLGLHHRLLYEVVAAKGPLSWAVLETAYRDACTDRSLEPVASRTVSKYLLQLRQLGILAREYRPGTGEWTYRMARDREVHKEKRE